MSVHRLVEKIPSLITPLTVIICAVLFGKAVSHYLEATYLSESEFVSSSHAARTPTNTSTEAPINTRSKDGSQFVTRNMFCSECDARSHEPAIAVASAGGEVPLTQLPLRLVATNVSTVRSSSFASIINTQTEDKGSYWMGRNIPGAGPIERINGRYVDFLNEATQRVERIRLDMPSASAARTTQRKPQPTTRGNSLAQTIENSVKQINDNTWEVERSVLVSLTGNPTALGRVRVSPAVKNGKPAGFRISRLPRNSPLEKIGVKRGDIIRAANGKQLNSPGVVLGMLGQIRSLNRMNLVVERGGKEIELNYNLR